MNALNHGERLGAPGPFLFGAALGYLAGRAFNAYQEDLRAGEEAWPYNPTTIVGVPKKAHRLILSLPGLGSRKGAAHAEAIKDVFEGPSAYVDYSTAGVSVDDITDKLLDAAPNLEILDINGHSMGGWFGFEVVKNAREKGMDLKIGNVALHCTPHDFGHVQNAITARGILAMHKMGIHGGPKTKRSVALVKRSLDEELWKQPLNREIREKVCKKAEEDAMSDTSTMLYSHMLNYYAKRARRCDNDCLLPLEDAFGPWTVVNYIRPLIPRQDRTVKTQLSVISYGNDCNARQIQFNDIRVPDMAHADMIKGCHALKQKHRI